jgi:hypothetical protein
MIQGAVANVLDYGASPTATAAENAAAFQLAIATGKTVYVPSGTYNINPITIASNLRIVGENKATTVLKPAGSADFIAYTWASTEATVLFRFQVENLKFDGANLTGFVFDISGAQYCSWRDLYFINLSQPAIRLIASYFNDLDVIDIANSAFGIWFQGTSFNNGPNHNFINNLAISNLTEWGVRMDFARGNIINGFDAEYGNNNLKSAIILEDSSYNQIHQFWYEALFATVADPAIKISGASTSNNKKNLLNWSPQIIHPSIGLDIRNSLNTTVTNYRFVGGTTNIYETGNTGLQIIDPQFETPSVASIDYNSVSTLLIDGGLSFTQRDNILLSLDTENDTINAINLKAAGVTKLRFATTPGSDQVDINTNYGNIATLLDDGNILIVQGLQLLNQMASASAINQSIFVDVSDGKLKFKDGSGIVHALY